MPPLDWDKEANTTYWWKEPNQFDPGMFFDYEDMEDSFENIAGAKPGQRYG